MADVTTDFFQALALGGPHPELENARARFASTSGTPVSEPPVGWSRSRTAW